MCIGHRACVAPDMALARHDAPPVHQLLGNYSAQSEANSQCAYGARYDVPDTTRLALWRAGVEPLTCSGIARPRTISKHAKLSHTWQLATTGAEGRRFHMAKHWSWDASSGQDMVKVTHLRDEMSACEQKSKALSSGVEF